MKRTTKKKTTRKPALHGRYAKTGGRGIRKRRRWIEIVNRLKLKKLGRGIRRRRRWIEIDLLKEERAQRSMSKKDSIEFVRKVRKIGDYILGMNPEERKSMLSEMGFSKRDIARYERSIQVARQGGII